MGKRRRLKTSELLAVLCLFLTLVAILIGMFAAVRWSRAEVCFQAKYYFLVEDCSDSTAAAVAGKVYSSGGAGYLLHGGDGVVLACYYTVREAERVQSVMREKGVETRIAELSAEKFYLNGGNAAFALRVEANAATAETCARLLYDAANGLERAERSQAEARSAVRGVRDAFAGLRKENAEGFFGRWNAELAEIGRECGEIAEEIVFAKDLRRIQAEILTALVGLDAYFS